MEVQTKGGVYSHEISSSPGTTVEVRNVSYGILSNRAITNGILLIVTIILAAYANI